MYTYSRWVCLRTMDKYGPTSIKGNRVVWCLQRSKKAPSVLTRTKKSSCLQILMQPWNRPYQILLQWFRAEDACQPRAGEWGLPKVRTKTSHVTSTVTLIQRSYRHNGDFLPFIFQKALDFLKMCSKMCFWKMWATQNAAWHFLPFSLTFLHFVFSFFIIQDCLWLLKI